MIWVIFSAMVAVVLIALVVPLVRARSAAMPSRAAYDLIVFQDQLAELDRDIERGVLDSTQAEAARIEIQRRILAAAEQGKEAKSAASNVIARRWTMVAAVFVVIGVPALTFGMYSRLGSPNLPDQPYADRVGKIKAIQSQIDRVEQMVQHLTDHLKKDPKDGHGWAMLGRSLRVLGRPRAARAAYRKALPLLPGDEQVRMEYAELLMEDLSPSAPLPPEFVRVMRQVLAIDPKSVNALYFVGLAEAQDGHPEKTKVLWTRLLANLPPNSATARAEITKELKALP